MMPSLSIPNKVLGVLSTSILSFGLMTVETASSLGNDNINKKENIGYYSQFETDASSVRPMLKVGNATLLIRADSMFSSALDVMAVDNMVSDDISEEEIVAEMLEHDLVLRMPPVKEYKIRVRIKSVEKASPRIVEPEEFDEEGIPLV